MPDEQEIENREYDSTNQAMKVNVVAGTVTSTPSGTQVVKGAGTAGTADPGVVTVQGIASGTAQPVSQATCTTATLSNTASSASNVTVLALNTARLGAHFFNDSTSACYLKMGATATSSSFTVKIAAAGYWEMPVYPVYTGKFDCIWDTANGSMRVTELSA